MGLLIGISAPAANGRAQSDSAVRVRDAQALRQAVAQAKPGSRILLAPGEYSGGFFFEKVRGEPGRPIVIAGEDPNRPPVIRGGGNGMHFAAPAYLELRSLTFVGAQDNGINIDDGGVYTKPAHHIVVQGVKIMDVGRGGNNDGIKLSGLTDFRIQDCAIERWGTGGGSAIDMVGCHKGTIEGNRFQHKPESAESAGNAIQMKGGTSRIVVRRNRFVDTGGRAVNIGGSTGLEVFRPPLSSEAGRSHAEARDITVEHNTFIGGGAPIAFVGVDGATARFNTIYRPKRWALRILQETRAPGFVPSRRGVFSDNLIAFRANEWSEAVNIGDSTAPETFRFARNFWYCLDGPERSRPRLPTPEMDGVYGRDPLFRDTQRGDLRLLPGSPAEKFGAQPSR